jgi:hypothetical protein
MSTLALMNAKKLDQPSATTFWSKIMVIAFCMQEHAEK